MNARATISLVLSLAILAGCAGSPPREPDAEPQAERSHGGKVVGGAGGAAVGGAMAYSSAGILCTIGGPLCMVFVIPAAIIGGVVGLAAGSVVDAVSDSAKEAKPASEPAAPRADSAERPGG